MKMLCIKFQQNRTINEEFDLFEAILNYYWQSYGNVLPQVSAESQPK